jgi:hypothetical protein
MPITAICQACHHQFQAPDAFAGKRVKCRHCGQVFQVPAAGAPPAGTGTPPAGRSAVGDLAALESLAGIESTGTVHGGPRPGRGGSLNGGSAINRAALVRPPAAPAPPPAKPPAAPGPTPGGRQLGPDEETADADPDDEDAEGADGKPAGARRPNFPVLSYPGAQIIDQGLPLALPVLGLGWLALLVSGDVEAEGKPWIQVARFAIPVLLYRVAIFPFMYAGLEKAAKELNYHLPPTPKLRAFAAYTPAFVFATALWIMGQGSLPGMIVGLTMGLVLSSMVLFLLFRLRENEAATTIAYAAYGFAIGAVLSTLLIVGLNYVTGVAVVRAKGQASVPISPYATGLPWLAKPPSTLTTEGDMVTHADRPRVASVLPPAVPTPAPDAVPDAAPPGIVSPLLSDLRTLSLPAAAGSTVVEPLSDAPVLALVRAGSNGASTAVAWDAVADRQAGLEVGLPAGQIGQPVIDDGAQYLAHIVTWPRRSIRFEAFASGHTVAKIDLAADVKDPSLFGFVGPDRLLVRGHEGTGAVTALGAALGNKPDDAPVMVVIDTADPKQTRTIALPPVAATGFPLAVSTTTRRLAVATQRDGVPAVVQFDLITGQPLSQAINLDLDAGTAVTPTGFTYTADGKRLGILFEHDGNAALLSYNALTGGDPAELDFPGPDGIAPPAARTAFKGNALASLDDGAWVVYGQRVINARTGDVLAPLPVDGVVDQRVLAGGRIALLTGAAGGPPAVQVATVDPAKYRRLTHASAATQP